MAFKIIRNDITKMNTEAVVNTANSCTIVGPGCDYAIYQAAGYDELLEYRKKNIGMVPEGEAFLTPGFGLSAKYIIHAVSPMYADGNSSEEEKLRSCYRSCFQLAKENQIKSIAFPLISTGSFGYPKEEGMRIAVDEVNAFLLENNMEIYLVVFDEKATGLGKRLYPDLEAYIDLKYVEEQEEYAATTPRDTAQPRVARDFTANCMPMAMPVEEKSRKSFLKGTILKKSAKSAERTYEACEEVFDFEEEHESRLQERMKHLSDTFSQYLMYLIQSKQMENAEVWKRAIVDKKVFSKIKNNPNYHPQKRTALCLCIGAKLNLDEAKDLLARAGYALSPCDKMDIIFSYFIENEIYDMIELDIQLEEHGVLCVIN